MRRFPRVRVLVTGFAAIALVSAVLAGGTTPAHATTAPVFNNLASGSGGACPKAQQPCQIVVADSADYATFSTAITAFTPGFPKHIVNVSCTSLLDPADPLPPTASSPASVRLKVRTPPPYTYGLYQYSCKATDSVTGASSTAKVSLTALDQPTFVHTPGFPWPSATADATDTATVSYPTITASEALTDGESDATTNDATFNGCVPVGPGPTSATSGDVPPSSPVARSRSGSPPSTALPPTPSMASLA